MFTPTVLILFVMLVHQAKSNDDDYLLVHNQLDLVPLEAKKDVNTFRIEKIDDFYHQFKQELSKQDLKKFLARLSSLSSDCENLIRSSSVLSHKQLNEFIDSALVLVHKKFNLKGNIDEFLAQFKKNEAEFVLHNNVIDQDLIKSNDWNFKTEIVENEFKSENLENFEFTGEKLRKNMERAKKSQQIINGMDGINDEINLGHNVFFFDNDLDD